MTAAVAAYGVTLVYNSQTVGEILEINGVKFDKNYIDVSNHGGGGYEEMILSGLIRTGEFTVKCNSVVGNAGQAAIKAAFDAATAYTAVITFPDGYYVSGSALVKDYEVVSDLENQLIIQHTFKWTGAVTDGTTASGNASDLALTTATLYPAFAAATYDYAAVSTGNTCTVTATFGAGTAALYREGVYVQALLTATPSGAVSLGADGTMTDLSIVITETGKAPVTYAIKVANAA